MQSEVRSIFDLRPFELAGEIRRLGLPGFRAAQVLDWVYGKLVTDVNQMSNIPKRERAVLSTHFAFALANVAARQSSADGTEKLLLTWPDGRVAETVMIPDEDRRTACVSSQTGCAVGCRFCASGIGGLQGSLLAGQIVEQVFALDRVLVAKEEATTNIVFMGMGEPLANFGQVMKSIQILHDEKTFDIGHRRITISTVGVPAKMRELADEGLPINLAISLHAPTEELRRELIPWAEHFALADILDAARYFFSQTGREVTLEYILLAGVNDSIDHARQLVKITKDLRANVNLLRYNEVEGLPYKRPESEDVVRFQDVLRHAGVNAHVRKSRGRDIAAACGQLRRREMAKTT